MTTILLIEDSAIIRQPIEAALCREGFRTLTAANGVEGLAQLSASRPDLILLDSSMPVMDGLTFLRQIRAAEATRDIPVIMLTADASRETVIGARKFNVSGYVLKTRFSLESLFAEIRKALGAQAPTAAPAPEEPATGPTAPAPTPATSAAPAPATAPTAPTLAAPVVHSGAAPSDPADLLKGLKSLLTRTEIADRIKNVEQLRAFSPLVTQLMHLTQRQDVSMDRIVSAVSQDQAISLKILRLANSPVYTRGEPVDSVRTAVVRIGIQAVRQAIVNIGVIDSFSQDAATALNLAHFWEHGIAAGLIASQLASTLGVAEPDSAFTMGLLHDVGRVLYAEQLRDVYPHVLRTAAELDLPVEQVESRLLLVNHADVMDRVLHGWQFAKSLIDPIVFHHLSAGNIRSVATSQAQHVMILALANRLAHALLLGSSGNEVIYPTAELCAGLRLGRDAIAAIEASVPQHASDMKMSMLTLARGEAWVRRRDQVRSALPTPVHPLFVSAEPGVDAFRIFCDTIGERSTEPPNVGVIHFAQVRERPMLTEKYVAAETKAGTGPLPLVVLTTVNKGALDRALTSRPFLHVVLTPAPVSRLVKALAAATRGEAAAPPAATPIAA